MFKTHTLVIQFLVMNDSVVEVYQQLNVLYVIPGMILIPGIKFWKNLCQKPVKAYKGISFGVRSEYMFMLQNQIPQKEKQTSVCFTT